MKHNEKPRRLRDGTAVRVGRTWVPLCEECKQPIHTALNTNVKYCRKCARKYNSNGILREKPVGWRLNRDDTQ